MNVANDLLPFVSVQWVPENVTLEEGRVSISPIRILNSTHVVLEAVFTSLQLSDTGYYSCVSSISGQYIRGTSTTNRVFLQVLGKCLICLGICIILLSPK